MGATSGCGGCATGSPSATAGKAAAVAMRAAERFWPARSPFPPAAPWLATVIDRPGVLARATALAERQYAAWGGTSNEGLARVQEKTAAFNDANRDQDCSDSWTRWLVELLATMVCYAAWEDEGCTAENVVFKFDSETCQIAKCSCASTGLPPGGTDPVPRITPTPFDDPFDDDHGTGAGDWKW